MKKVIILCSALVFDFLTCSDASAYNAKFEAATIEEKLTTLISLVNGQGEKEAIVQRYANRIKEIANSKPQKWMGSSDLVIANDKVEFTEKVVKGTVQVTQPHPGRGKGDAQRILDEIEREINLLKAQSAYRQQGYVPSQSELENAIKNLRNVKQKNKTDRQEQDEDVQGNTQNAGNQGSTSQDDSQNNANAQDDGNQSESSSNQRKSNEDVTRRTNESFQDARKKLNDFFTHRSQGMRTNGKANGNDSQNNANAQDDGNQSTSSNNQGVAGDVPPPPPVTGAGNVPPPPPPPPEGWTQRIPSSSNDWNASENNAQKKVDPIAIGGKPALTGGYHNDPALLEKLARIRAAMEDDDNYSYYTDNDGSSEQ